MTNASVEYESVSCQVKQAKERRRQEQFQSLIKWFQKFERTPR
jgi:hypothetical protein